MQQCRARGATDSQHGTSVLTRFIHPPLRFLPPLDVLSARMVHGTDPRGDSIMMDAIFLGLVFAFGVACWGLIALCDRLMGGAR